MVLPMFLDLANGNKAVDSVRSFLDSSGGLNSTGGLINQGTTLEPFLTLNTIIPVDGNYRVYWDFVWSYNQGSQDFISEIQVNGNAITEQRQEPKDVAGVGIVLDVIGGGTTNTGTNQRYMAGGSSVVALIAGPLALRIVFAGSTNNDEAAIYRAQLAVEIFS